MSTTTESGAYGAVDGPGDSVHRARVYKLLSLGFDRPDGELEEAVEDGVFHRQLRESVGAVYPSIVDDVDPLEEYVDCSDDLHGEYASSFGVEEGATVSLNEVDYAHGGITTNTDKLADIAGFYHAFDLSISEGRRDRVDLLSTELEFMQDLAVRDALLRDEGDSEGVSVVTDAEASFIRDHLGRWMQAFEDEVSEVSDGFHADLARLLRRFVEREAEAFEVEPDTFEDAPEGPLESVDLGGDETRFCGDCGPPAPR